MIFKKLLEIAVEGLSDLSTLENPDFRLEQAEYIEKDKIWEIIVSYLVDNTNKKSTSISAITGVFQYFRIYKKLKINDQNEIIGFYIYENK